MLSWTAATAAVRSAAWYQQFYKGKYKGHLENLGNWTGTSSDTLDPTVENLMLSGRNLFQSVVSLEAHKLADAGIGGGGVTVHLILALCSMMLIRA